MGNLFLVDPNGQKYTYEWLATEIENYIQKFRIPGAELPEGAVVCVCAEYNPYFIALMRALMQLKAIIVLVLTIEASRKPVSFIEAEFSVTIKGSTVFVDRIGARSKNLMYETLRKKNHAGLVLLTSGSGGSPKGIVHDFDQIWLSHQEKKKNPYRTIPVMKLDHIGGLNTLLSCLNSQGVLYIPSSLNPFILGRMIEKYQIQLLPATPSFLRQILMASRQQTFNLQSLECITYGAEPASQNLLFELKNVLPKVFLKQTYGLSETGILSTQSLSSESLYFQILQNSTHQTRIVNGELQIKSKNMMLGYLNAAQPFTDDGWLQTKDQVQESDIGLRVMGRKSDMINIGGNKVYPIEIESIISEIDFVEDVTVSKAEHLIFGEIIQAQVVLRNKKVARELKIKIKKHCALQMEKFKIPVSIQFVDQVQLTTRLKKDRQL